MEFLEDVFSDAMDVIPEQSSKEPQPIYTQPQGASSQAASDITMTNVQHNQQTDLDRPGFYSRDCPLLLFCAVQTDHSPTQNCELCFRSGNPYFPFYSVALQDYPGFYVPHPQIHTRMNRRPHFNPHPSSPMFYHATRFRHFSSPGKRTECKETQTDLRQQENKSQKNVNLSTNTRVCDVGNMACLSSGVRTENESNSENLESSMLSETAAAAQERDFHKNPASYRNLLPGSYAFEKEEVRIEYGGGSPAAIQLWKSYKETIPLYDVATEKEMPDNVLHRDMYSVRSCQGVLHGPGPEGEEMVSHNTAYAKDSCRPVPSQMPCLEAVHEKEIQSMVGQNIVGGREPEKRVQASPIVKAALAAEVPRQSLKHPELSSSTHNFNNLARQGTQCRKSIHSNGFQDQDESDNGEQDGLLKSSLEAINDLGLLSASQMPSCESELKLASRSSLWAEDAVEDCIPSSSWLTCFDDVETNCSYDMCLPQRKQKRTSVLSVTSDDLSSRDEGSSMDNAPASYFVPDYMLKKSIYTFQKSTDSSEKEKIKSGGSLNEDEQCIRREQTNCASSQYSKSKDAQGLADQKVKVVSGRNRKMGVSLRDVSRRKLYSLKKKPRKNMSLSEPEDSEDYWVVEETVNGGGGEEEEETDEAEYFLQKCGPNGQSSVGKGKLYKQAAPQKVIWKPTKGTVPPQLIRWPSCDKIKTKKKGVHESPGQVHRPKQKEQEVECESYVKRPAGKQERYFKEVPEQRKSVQKSLGGKAQKDHVGLSNEEYWTGRGAKPKFSEHPYEDPALVKSKEQDKLPRRRGLYKPSSKSKPTLSDPEEVEVWVAPLKPSGHRGRGTKKMVYRR